MHAKEQSCCCRDTRVGAHAAKWGVSRRTGVRAVLDAPLAQTEVGRVRAHTETL